MAEKGLDLPLNLDSVANGLAKFNLNRFPFVFEMTHNNIYYQNNQFVYQSYTDYILPNRSYPSRLASYNETLRDCVNMNSSNIELFKFSLFINGTFATELVPTNYYVGVYQPTIKEINIDSYYDIYSWKDTSIKSNFSVGDGDVPIFSATAGHLSSFNGNYGYKGNGVYVYGISHMALIDMEDDDNVDYIVSLKANISNVIN